MEAVKVRKPLLPYVLPPALVYDDLLAGAGGKEGGSKGAAELSS